MMNKEEYESEEESEFRREQELKRLENDPTYMQASWEDFWLKPSDIKAKRLWLKCTKLREAVPPEVIDRMFDIIERQVEDAEIKHDPETNNKAWRKERLLELLYIAIKEPDLFWRVLLAPNDHLDPVIIGSHEENDWGKLQKFLPERKELKPEELFKIFGAVSERKELVDELKEDIEQQYRRYVRKNIKVFHGKK